MVGRVKGYSQSVEDILLDSFVYLTLVLLALAIVFPFWTMLVDSFSSARSSNQLGFRLFPSEPSLDAYTKVFRQSIIGIAYLNTVFRTVVGTILTVLATLFAAYALSKRDLPLKKMLTILIVFTMFFGGGLIPTYMLVRRLGLIGSRWALVLPMLVSPFALIIMRNFMYSIPQELEESAFIDGANEITILFKIILPLSLPIIATVALWTAVDHWNEWFHAMIYVRDRNKIVLQLLLRRVMVEDQGESLLDDFTRVKTVTATSIKAATLFVTIGPIVLLYPFIQKYFVKGIKLGGVKE